MRLALVVHPTRPIAAAVETLERWAAENGWKVVQIQAAGQERQVAEHGELDHGDLVIALGGDGTVLGALRASAPKEAPVLGVACGSLGALTAIPAYQLTEALERFRTGDWTPRALPALSIEPAGAAAEWAINDFVVARRGAGQMAANVYVDDELYVRLAGDGVIVATALGSSAYSMAAGGPVLVSGTPAFVCTPLAMHGGNAPPVVVPAGASVRVEVRPSFAGFQVELDGRPQADKALDYRVSMHGEKVTLVSLGALGLGLADLRGRRLITDSPRVLAREDRSAPR